MNWFAWVIISYFWLNLALGISRLGESVVFTRASAVAYVGITAFMTWAALTQIG